MWKRKFAVFWQKSGWFETFFGFILLGCYPPILLAVSGSVEFRTRTGALFSICCRSLFWGRDLVITFANIKYVNYIAKPAFSY